MPRVEWLAGIVEGEGCLYSPIANKGYGYRYFTPKIRVKMTDRDVVDNVASMLGQSVVTIPSKGVRKEAYAATVSGVPALTWMLKLFPFLGNRRRAKVDEVLTRWERSYNRA